MISVWPLILNKHGFDIKITICVFYVYKKVMILVEIEPGFTNSSSNIYYFK